VEITQLTPPSGATYLYISLVTTTLKLVGVAAGTGWNIGLGKSAMFHWAAAAYVMNSSAIGTVDLKVEVERVRSLNRAQMRDQNHGAT